MAAEPPCKIRERKKSKLTPGMAYWISGGDSHGVGAASAFFVPNERNQTRAPGY
jgi:hypothetical protein